MVTRVAGEQQQKKNNGDGEGTKDMAAHGTVQPLAAP
jgi:hypothetical protein